MHKARIYEELYRRLSQSHAEIGNVLHTCSSFQKTVYRRLTEPEKNGFLFCTNI